jgi:thiamine thiazole synthase
MVQLRLVEVDETVITRAIVEGAARDLANLAEVDVAVVGAGPAGMTVARYLAKGGAKTVVFERRLSFGGGIGGGGMLLPRVVVQEPADRILAEVGVKLDKVGEGVYTAHPAEMIAKLAAGAIDAGAKIVLGATVDDVVFRSEGERRARICGVVIQWTAVEMSGLHVDPLAIKCKAVADCTGHDAEVCAIVMRKIPDLKLEVPGEMSMWTPFGENAVVERAGEVVEGLYVAGMAVAAVYRLPRMGPIFGGMLLSAAKVATQILNRLFGEKAPKVVPIEI